MPYAKTSLRKEKRELRDRMRSMGCDYRQIAAEFARAYRLRPRAAWREAYGWSLQETADRINVYRGATGLDSGGISGMTSAHLCEYENWPGYGVNPGGRKPSPYLLAVLAGVYNCDVTDLVDAADREHLPRADLLVIDTYVRPSAPQSPELRKIESVRSSHACDEAAEGVIDVLSRVHRLSRSVNPEVVLQLHDDLQDTITRYETLDHSVLAPFLVKQRTWIDVLMNECSHPGQRQQLLEIAAATSGLLGYVAVGRGDFPLARAYCLEAFQLGTLAAAPNLQAWARGSQSFCEYYAGRYEEALRLAQDGLIYAGSGPQSVRLTANGAARAMGKLGDASGVHRAVDQAYALMSRNEVPGGVPSSISLGCYSMAQTASNAATAYVSLSMPDKAQHYVSLALPEISKSDSPWSRSLVMIDLALSLTRARDADLDRAAGLVLEALSISVGRPVISVQQRSSEFIREAAARWGDSRQVSALRDAAAALEKR